MSVEGFWSEPAEETRGGEEPFDWRVSPDAIREAEERRDDETP